MYLLVALAIVAWDGAAPARLLRTRSLWPLLLASGLTNACFNWAVTIGDVIRVVLLFYLMPAWAALFARLLLGEALPVRAVARIALAIAGAAIVLQGHLIHRGGANRSGAPRLAVTNQYCQPWARTQENFFLGVPRERAAALSPRLQALLGYEIWPPFMGHVTGSHPAKTLVPGWAAPVAGDLSPDTG